MKIQQWNGGRTRNGIMAGVCGMIGLVASSAPILAQYAVEVKRYESGTGFATEFGTGVGYTNVSSILGEPTRSIPGPFGGPVEPFNPPWQVDQLLSMGTGGVVEIRLDTPATRSPLNPYGIDFLVFGGTGFIITNGDYSGGGITDGSVFGDDRAEVKVSVSVDGLQYFTLDGSLSPVLESLFPTDGGGDFGVPVNPGLSYADFNGLGLVGIRGLYAGSGGGAGFSLAWARDGDGRQVSIDSASYIRIEVQSGRVELDGVSVVRPVPEPSTWVLLLAGSMGLVGVARRVGRDSSNR